MVLRSVCEAVSRRTCFLLAAGLAALLKKMDNKDVTVAVDGSLFRYHPHFRRNIEYRMQQLMGVEYGFRMIFSEDGSGRGAALVAATLAGDVRKKLEGEVSGEDGEKVNGEVKKKVSGEDKEIMSEEDNEKVNGGDKKKMTMEEMEKMSRECIQLMSVESEEVSVKEEKESDVTEKDEECTIM